MPYISQSDRESIAKKRANAMKSISSASDKDDDKKKKKTYSDEPMKDYSGDPEMHNKMEKIKAKISQTSKNYGRGRTA